MIEAFDDATLAALFTRAAETIAVPDGGAARVIDRVGAAMAQPRPAATRPRPWLAVAAVIAIVAGAIVALAHVSSNTSEKSSAGSATPATAVAPVTSVPGASREVVTDGRSVDSQSKAAGPAGSPGGAPSVSTTAPPAPPPAGTTAPTPSDSAKIVKTGTLDLQVAHNTLRAAVSRVTTVAVGLGGYVANSKTDFGGSETPTATITIRVPVAAFDSAVSRLENVSGATVLDDSESGSDVTAQYTDLNAQLTAAKGERDQLLVLLSHTQTIGDILSVRDRLAAAQTQVDQLQGQINVLGDQAAFSSIALSLTEKAVVRPHPVAHHAAAPTGLRKAWDDARSGFAHSVEWLIARSGGALIVLLALLAALFGLRYLYPVVRRLLI